MTSQNPPYPYFDGITYNSSFFGTTTSSGLTQAVANTLYLRKTVADIATSSETFSAGILTNGIEQIGTTNITLYGNTTTASIGLGGGQTAGNKVLGISNIELEILISEVVETRVMVQPQQDN